MSYTKTPHPKARCSRCGVELGTRPNRIARNPNRKCLPCYRDGVKRRHISEGYVRVVDEDGTRDYEHRRVMASVLGRPLLRNEIVHHKNGDRADNRPENLTLCESPGRHALDEGHVVQDRRSGRFVSGWTTFKR